MEVNMALDVNQVIADLRPRLRTYLESKGVIIDSGGFFRCIHPEHDDRHPSCSIGGSPNEEVFHCFSRAGHDGNIFTAAHWLDNMPVSGEEFFNDTLKKLADQFGIPYEPMELSPDVKREVAKCRAYRDALGVLNSMTYSAGVLKSTHVGIKHLLDRGISEISIRNFDACVIDSFTAYIDAMHGLGWTDDEFLKEAGLAHKGIFDRYSVIFPIYDKKSRPVGFVSRNTKFNPNDHGTMKYVNSNNSDIYCKGNILYNYNNVYKKPGPLYIVEGYLDAVYLTQAGLEKVAAIGATILTDSHIEMLLEDNQNGIILCLDSDEGGKKGTEIALERLAPLKAFNIQILDLPKDEDPDSYVRKNGLEKFRDYILKSAFTWTLEQSTSFNDDLVDVAKKAIPTIATEDSAVTRLKMIRELSQYTSVPEVEIKRDVEALLDRQDSKYLEDVRNINQAVQFKLNKRSLNETRTILREAMVKLDSIDEKYSQKSDLQGDFFDKLTTLESRIRGGDYKFGLRTPSFPIFQKILDGVPYWANVMWIGGRPSAGKCLRPGTPVLMYDGNIKTIENVKIGDYLMGPDSKPRKVLSLGSGEDNMYDIIPKRGMVWGCNESHILSLKMSSDNGSTYKKDQVFNLTIEEYLSKNNKFKHHAKLYRSGWELEEQNVPYDPYFIGSWLGDGTLGKPEITTADTLELEEYYQGFAASNNLTCKKVLQERQTYRLYFGKCGGKINHLYSYIRDVCIQNNEKRIPSAYLLNSKSNRLELLAGLIDTDGSLCRTESHSYEITTKYKGLKDDILYLSNSLGFLTTFKIKTVTFNNKKLQYYRIHISGDIYRVPVKLSRKKATHKDSRTNHLSTGFTIKHAGKGKYYGVVLDNDHLFLLGDGTVTHNTAFMTAMAMDIIDANDDAVIFYQSIDDNLDLLMTKMLAVRSGLTTTEIRQYGKLRGNDKDAFEESMVWLRSVKDRLIIADASHGNTVDKLESHVSYFCRQFPDQKKLYLLDNFHKLQMTSRTGDKRADAISDTSSQIKNISLLNDIPIISTVELRKLATEKDRPTRQDMQGSNKLDYDADVIALVHNDRQINRETKLVWTGSYKDKVEEMPYIEIDIVKNKINGRDGMIPYRFNKFNMRLTEDTYETWAALKQQTPRARSSNF